MPHVRDCHRHTDRQTDRQTHRNTDIASTRPVGFASGKKYGRKFIQIKIIYLKTGPNLTRPKQNLITFFETFGSGTLGEKFFLIPAMNKRVRTRVGNFRCFTGFDPEI